METIADIAACLDGAAHQDANTRRQAEEALKQYKQADPTKFVCSLIKELCEESNSQNARALAAVLFKNTLVNTTQEEGGNGVWYGLSEETRGFIKEALFGMLASEDRGTLKNASICLAIIAAIEVPDGLWDDFLQVMQENSTHENVQHRFATVQTLGLLCEFLDEYFDKQLLQEQIGQILHATICNIAAEHVELTQLAIKALARTIPSTGPNFAVQAQREFIMEGLFRAIAIDDEQIQSDALEALAETPQVAYTHLSEHIPQIGEVTVNFLNAGAFGQTRGVLTFWLHLCQCEIAQSSQNGSLNLIRQYKDALLQILFQALEITEYDDEDVHVEDSQDDVTWTVSRAGSTVLVEVATLLGDEILPLAIRFAGGKLNSPRGWQDQYVAMVALGSVLDGPSPEHIQRELDPAYPAIVGTLGQAQSSRVRGATAWLVAQMVRFAPQMIFAKQEYLNQLFDAGMPLITSDHLQVRQHIATAWQTAFEKANELSAQACAMLNPRFGECMAAMIDCLFSIDAMSTGTLASFSNSVSSTLEACDGANLREPLLATCEGLYTKITAFAQSPNDGLNDEQKETFLNHWCGTLQPCLVRLGDQGVTDPVLEHLVALAVSTFRQLRKVTSGGLFILHGLTVTVGDRIAPHMATFMDYVLCALKMTDCDAMGTRVACGLVSDLANSLGDSINPSMPSIVPPLLAVLEDNTFDSEVKLIAIIAFGDICLAAGPRNFQQYLPQTQQSLAQACSLSLGKGATPEEVDLLERLRIALVDAYISILHGLAPDGGSLQASPASEQQLREAFATQTFQYLEAMVSDKTLSFPSELLRPVYELYLDLAAMFVTSADEQSMRSRPNQQQMTLLQLVTESTIHSDLRQGLQALDQDDRCEIEQRFADTERSINELKSRMASPGPQFSQQPIY